jgi:hypothetical protein
VVEHANDVGDFEAALIVETNLAQRRPIVRANRAGIDAELLSDGTERALAVGQGRVRPMPALDRRCRLVIATLGTQKLCVRCRSVEALLRRRRNRGDHLALLAIERAGGEHNLVEEALEGGADPRVRHQ